MKLEIDEIGGSECEGVSLTVWKRFISQCTYFAALEYSEYHI